MPQIPSELAKPQGVFKRTAEWVGAAAILVAAIWGVWKFVDWRVEKALGDASTLRRIAGAIHPSCVFDEQKRFLHDVGARRLIEDLEFENSDGSDGVPTAIIIRFREHLNVPALLTSLGPGFVTVRLEPGPMSAWVFRLDYHVVLALGAPPPATRAYRLEIFR